MYRRAQFSDILITVELSGSHLNIDGISFTQILIRYIVRILPKVAKSPFDKCSYKNWNLKFSSEN